LSLLPFVAFDSVPLDVANECLRRWGHKMGPIRRPMGAVAQHALLHEGRPVAVVTTSTLIREAVQGCAADEFNRETTVELSRLCAVRPGLCRVAIRLWREFVFPELGYALAISYQDADLHTGRTYRFDGWSRIAFARAGGADPRSGRKARNKYVWCWPPRMELPTAEVAAVPIEARAGGGRG
jgi:antitoxin VapB